MGNYKANIFRCICLLGIIEVSINRLSQVSCSIRCGREFGKEFVHAHYARIIFAARRRTNIALHINFSACQGSNRAHTRRVLGDFQLFFFGITNFRKYRNSNRIFLLRCAMACRCSLLRYLKIFLRFSSELLPNFRHLDHVASVQSLGQESREHFRFMIAIGVNGRANHYTNCRGIDSSGKLSILICGFASSYDHLTHLYQDALFKRRNGLYTNRFG